MKYSDVIRHEKWNQWAQLIYGQEQKIMICELSTPFPASKRVEHISLDISDPQWEMAISRGRLISRAPEMYHILSRIAKEVAVTNNHSYDLLIEAAELLQQIRRDCYPFTEPDKENDE